MLCYKKLFKLLIYSLHIDNNLTTNSHARQYDRQIHNTFMMISLYVAIENTDISSLS